MLFESSRCRFNGSLESGACALLLLAIAILPIWTARLAGAVAATEGPPESVRGRGCYTYGDDETPTKARRAALAIAQEDAVRSYRVYVESSTTVKNFQVEDDVIQSAAAGMLRKVQTEEETSGRTVCVRITAEIDAAELDRLIQQMIHAKRIANDASASLLSAASTFSVKLWTNRSGPYVEGETMTISVQSDRDAYLKLDYFQADGAVVHLVPNIYGGEAFIRAGRVYTFGGPGDSQKFVVIAPFGAEALKAIASTKPFANVLATPRASEDGVTYLRGLERGIRPAASGNPEARWAEASVAVVTVSKTAADHRVAVGARKEPR